MYICEHLNIEELRPFSQWYFLSQSYSTSGLTQKRIPINQCHLIVLRGASDFEILSFSFFFFYPNENICSDFNTKVLKGQSEIRSFRIIEVSLVLFIMLANTYLIPSVKPHEWGSAEKEKCVFYYMAISSLKKKMDDSIKSCGSSLFKNFFSCSIVTRIIFKLGSDSDDIQSLPAASRGRVWVKISYLTSTEQSWKSSDTWSLQQLWKSIGRVLLLMHLSEC